MRLLRLRAAVWSWMWILALGASLAGCPGSGDPPNLILITIDTLRADHLGSYGYRHDTSPNIDALAARGVRFADASVQWPSTWPSMASMLTGTYPAQTGVRHRPYVALPVENVTLAERLQQANYQTAAIVSNANLGFKMAFDQGFDHFVESWMEEFERQTGQKNYRNRPGRVKEFTDAKRVTDQALAWLAKRDETRPFFLWVHYMDVHGPYLPPKAYLHLFPDGYTPNEVPLDAIPRYQHQIGPNRKIITDLSYYTRRYDQEIRYVDTELQRLLDALESVPGTPLLALSADHGESLSEHKYYLEHGAAPFQPAARVPLVFVQKGKLPAGKVIERPVGMVQLVPTLLDLLGLPVPADLPEQSLVPLLHSQSEGTQNDIAPFDVYMQAGTNQKPQRIVRRGPWKFVDLRDRKDQIVFGLTDSLLFNLDEDPGEERNLAKTHPALVKQLRQSLEQWEKSPSQRHRGIEPELSPEERQMLEDLGYLFE